MLQPETRTDRKKNSMLFEEFSIEVQLFLILLST